MLGAKRVRLLMSDNLQATGVGLPKYEYLFIKYIFIPTVKKCTNFNILMNLFLSETKKLKRAIDSVSSDDLSKRVVIKKLIGLEDNSRDFSINMVFEHIFIVGSMIKEGLVFLNNNQNFDVEVSIKGVKPINNNNDFVGDFFKFVDGYKAFYEQMPKVASKTTKAHPWFGELNSYEWHMFLFIHTFVHRRQVEAIAKSLKII